MSLKRCRTGSRGRRGIDDRHPGVGLGLLDEILSAELLDEHLHLRRLPLQ